MTVTIAGIVSIWFTSFTKTTTQTIGGEVSIEIICMHAGISFSDVCYSNGYISGYFSNTGKIALGGIVLTILYRNGSFDKYYLSYAEGKIIPQTSCCGNLTLFVNDKYSFNVSVSSDFDRIYISTNCTKVSDEVKASEMTPC